MGLITEVYGLALMGLVKNRGKSKWTKMSSLLTEKISGVSDGDHFHNKMKTTGTISRDIKV